MLQAFVTLALICFVTLLSALVIISWQVPEPDGAFARKSVAFSEDAATRAVTSLQAFLRFETVCSPGEDVNVGDASAPAFAAARDHLKHTYSRLLSNPAVSIAEVNTYSLLLEWKGSQPELAPLLVCGHFDVVPVGNDSIASWSHDPFGGHVVGGYVWGRGTMDMKSAVIGLWEGLEALHERGYRPTRTILAAFGHDEEVGGPYGAGAIAARLRARGTRAALVWDEGTAVLADGFQPLVAAPVALVATAEKVRQPYKLTIRTAGGHAAMPPIDGSDAGSVLARALAALRRRPPPLRLRSPVVEMFKAIAPHAPLLLRGPLAFCDVWPFSSLVPLALSKLSPATNALVRSTFVPTLVRAGVATNVVPMHSELTFDMRLLPGDDGDTATAHVVRALRSTGVRLVNGAGESVPRTGPWWDVLCEAAGRARAQLSAAGGLPSGLMQTFSGSREEAQESDRDHASTRKKGPEIRIEELVERDTPAPISPTGGRWWQLLSQSIQEGLVPHDSNGTAMRAIPIMVPGLLSGRTDSSHYHSLSENGVFRFVPWSVNVTAGDPGRVHGIDERLHLKQFLAAVQFYVHALEVMSSDADA